MKCGNCVCHVVVPSLFSKEIPIDLHIPFLLKNLFVLLFTQLFNDWSLHCWSEIGCLEFAHSKIRQTFILLYTNKYVVIIYPVFVIF